MLIISLIFLVILGLYLYRQTQQKATINHPKTSQTRKPDKKIKTKPKNNHDATNKNIPTNRSTSNQAIPEAMQGTWYPADDENISGLNGYLQINNETLTWTIAAPQQEQGTYVFKIDRDGTGYNLTPQGSAPFENSSYLIERQDADTITLAFHGGTARFSKNPNPDTVNNNQESEQSQVPDDYLVSKNNPGPYEVVSGKDDNTVIVRNTETGEEIEKPVVHNPDWDYVHDRPIEYN